MSDEQFNHFRQYVETIQRQIAVLRSGQFASNWQEGVAALEGLQLIYEEMQASLEAAEVVEEELLHLNRQVTEDYQRYYKLFQSSPIAYVLIDPNGLILEANQAIAQMLNVPQLYLAGKPFAVFVAEGDRLVFRTRLSQLSQLDSVQQWDLSLCPRAKEPFWAQLHVANSRNNAGSIEALQIGVYDMSQAQKTAAQLAQQPSAEAIAPKVPLSSLPQSLDGLQVLVVDDEADAREFIAAVLESHGVYVTAVASAAAALEVLERFHPDVLVSDIRMPNEDGCSLIRKVRQLEAQKGWHIPAAALTTHLEEDREKALNAGFESYLHKLAQPTELVELVAQLAGYIDSNRAC